MADNGTSNNLNVEKKSWEGEFKKKWTEVENVSSKTSVASPIVRKFNRSIMRHLNIIVDFSDTIEEMDFLPTNKVCILEALKHFKTIFKRENPLSILTTTFYQHENALFETSPPLEGKGKFNLKKAVEFSLKNIKDNYIKEFLIITCSINNEGGGPPPVKMSFINLNGEVQFFKNLASEKNYIVPMTPTQLNEALLIISEPDFLNSNVPISFLDFCFPEVLNEDSLCTCHLKLTKIGYVCSCGAKVCKLPALCPICKIQMVSSLVLSQNAYQYSEVIMNPVVEGSCIICQENGIFECCKCLNIFCNLCKRFIESSTRFCPVC
ncbi:General transcription factor IIH subunit 2 [Cucumispora dikerogammari]|nr:General transcription factor IIH subunit 2 [Cucumispora dikerogammari]